jgi:acyl-CoA thioesterase
MIMKNSSWLRPGGVFSIIVFAYRIILRKVGIIMMNESKGTENNIKRVMEDAERSFHFKFLECENGTALTKMKITDDLLNILGIPYGAYIFNMADLTAGCANLSLGKYGPTINANIQFIKSAKPGDEIYCRANVTHKGHRVSYFHADVFKMDHDTKKIIASTEFTFCEL